MGSLTCLSEMGFLIMLMKMNYADQCFKIFTKVQFLKNNLINKYPTPAAVIVLKEEVLLQAQLWPLVTTFFMLCTDLDKIHLCKAREH